MILLLDTSTSTCKLTFIEGDWRHYGEWQADRELAKSLLSYLRDQLHEVGKTWKDISAIGVYRGPGSFTGLRIGMSVLNTIADSEKIPIVGTTGDNWIQEAIEKIEQGQNEKLVLPEYGSEANITKPKK